MGIRGDSMQIKEIKRKNKGFARFRLLVTLFACLVLMIVVVTVYVFSALSAADPGTSEEIKVEIPEGANSYQIARLLSQEEIIKNERAFIYFSRLTGKDSLLKSGSYLLSPSYAIPEIIDKLVEGSSDSVIFTVPEGYTVEQIANLLEEKGLINRDRFDRLVAEGDFPFPFLRDLEDLPEGSCRLEGYLFPDTYHVGKNISENELITVMLKRFQREMEDLQFPEKVAEKGFTLNEGITIASMVEREAKVDRERPIIAGVILNRLDLGMPLQIDATVQYVLKGHRPTIYYEDLEVDSPYNTYRVMGLPPGPIGAPGRKSLLAVIEPEKTDYLYYVAKPDGSHAFARTLQEHNANINKYQ
jgi:UPF0755 protein